MTSFRATAICLGLLFFAADAKARIAPSFVAEDCAWNATHIVVVKKGEKIDGTFEVLESWKGDLKKGDHIRVPEFAAFSKDDARRVSKGMVHELMRKLDEAKGIPHDKEDESPTHVTCNRMVLFLIKSNTETAKGTTADFTWESASSVWKKEMKVSAVWIEAGKVYAFEQEINPGPSELVERAMTEGELRTEVDRVVRARERLMKSLNGENPSQLTDMAVALVTMDDTYLARRVVDALGEAGKKALPALRKLFADDRLDAERDNIVLAMGRAGGTDAGPDILAVLKRELAYWKEHGPRLQEGWWNGQGLRWEEAEPVRRNWHLSLATIKALGASRYKVSRETIVEFQAYWLSLPQLGRDQISEACDEALAGLR